MSICNIPEGRYFSNNAGDKRSGSMGGENRLPINFAVCVLFRHVLDTGGML